MITCEEAKRLTMPAFGESDLSLVVETAERAIRDAASRGEAEVVVSHSLLAGREPSTIRTTLKRALFDKFRDAGFEVQMYLDNGLLFRWF